VVICYGNLKINIISAFCSECQLTLAFQDPGSAALEDKGVWEVTSERLQSSARAACWWDPRKSPSWGFPGSGDPAALMASVLTDDFRVPLNRKK
jgi:hypothetical protein